MSDTERPVPDRPEDQTAQAQHLTATGNGPTVDDEQHLLAAAYGPPDMAGFYTQPGPIAVEGEHGPETLGFGDGEQAVVDDQEQPAETAAPADGAAGPGNADGGASA